MSDNELDILKGQMIEEARKKYGEISVCPKCDSMEDSFTIVNSAIILWFNDSDRSTHVIKKNIK